MSKEFEEAKLVITADIVFDPDDISDTFHKEMIRDITRVFNEYCMLYKNTQVTLESFICGK